MKCGNWSKNIPQIVRLSVGMAYTESDQTEGIGHVPVMELHAPTLDGILVEDGIYDVTVFPHVRDPSMKPPLTAGCGSYTHLLPRQWEWWASIAKPKLYEFTLKICFHLRVKQLLDF